MVKERPCTIHHDGKFYDLSPLKSKADYELKSLDGHEFILNVCQSVSRRLWNIDIPDGASVGGFIRQDRGDFSVGAVNTTLDMRGSSPLLFMASGSICTDEELTASTSIHFICDSSIAGVGKPTVISQLPPADEDACSFFLEWRTPVACPTTESAGFYGYFAFSLASFVALLMLYLVCGTLYNRFVLRLSGFDQIPQFSLTSLKYHVSAAFENIRDMFESFYLGSRGTGLGISGSRTDANRRGMNPHSHQWMHGSTNLGNSSVDDSSPTSGRRRFDLEQHGVTGTREEREPIVRSDTDQGVDEGAADSLSTPTVASVRKGMDQDGVIRL